MTTTMSLLGEEPLLIPPKLAAEIGLNEAIVLQQIHFWIRVNIKLKRAENYQDGRWWTYNSVKDWQTQFPFWSISTVRRALDALEGKGYITTGNYNKAGYDQTKWYSINYDALPVIDLSPAPTDIFPFAQNEQMGSGETFPVAQNEQLDLSSLSDPIPETNSETKLTTPPTGGAEAPIPEQLSMKDQFYQMLKELEDTPANKRVAKLMGIYVHCYGDKNLPDYGKLGAVAKKIGSAGRLAEMMWLNTTKQITGDPLDYIVACERNRKKGSTNGNGRKKSTTGANTDAGQGYTQPASQTPADEAARIRAALGLVSPLASD